MASDTFGFLVDQNTLLAVVLGAILATIGGFVATTTERYLDKRERERNAALFFGEVLSTLIVILVFADDSKKIGDPYGPVTMRLLRSARREIDIYDRNRESLFYLGSGELRAMIQTLVIRLGMALDNIIELAQEIDSLRLQLKITERSGEREDIESRIARNETRREGAYGFIQETSGQLGGAVAGLEPLAGQSFDRVRKVARSL
jgi:hypothetical protein